jgi:hypothetical protein
MPKEKIIKSGQFTLSRFLFLILCGGLIVASVWGGGVWLTLGYWAISLGLCALLFVVSIDYGINMDKVEFRTPSTAPVASIDTFTSAPAPAVAESANVARIKRQGKRPAKRRR